MSELQDAVTLAQDLRVDAELAFRPSHADVELEAAIDIEMAIVLHDERYSHDERVAAFTRVADLHRQRRPQMVAHLELERGLRK